MTIRKLLIYSVMALSSATTMAQKIVFSSNNVNTGATLWKKPVTATFKFHNIEQRKVTANNTKIICFRRTKKEKNNSNILIINNKRPPQKTIICFKHIIFNNYILVLYIESAVVVASKYMGLIPIKTNHHNYD